MEYTLTIDLAGDGEDKISKILDKLAGLKSSKPGMPSFKDWLNSPDVKDAADTVDYISSGGTKGRRKGGTQTNADAVKFYRNLTTLVGVAVHPGGALNNMFAARQVFSAFMTNTGQGMIGGSGIGGALKTTGGALAFVNLLGMAFKSMISEVQKLISSIGEAQKSASQLYSDSLMQGMSMAWVARRQSIAGVLGVSEKEISRFSGVSGSIISNTAQASDSLARNAPILTGIEQIKRETEINKQAFNSEIGKSYSWFSSMLAKSDLIAAKADLSIRRWFNDSFGIKGSEPAHTPLLMSKQLKASNFERMGLVIGGGGLNTTNELLKRSNGYLKTIASAVDKKGNGSSWNHIFANLANLP